MSNTRIKALNGVLLSMLLVTSMVTFFSLHSTSSNTSAAPKDTKVLNESGSFTVTTYPVADAYVQEGYPDTNYGAETKIIARSRGYPGTAGYGQMRGFLKFDISDVPPGSIITEAKLRLHCYYITDYIKNASDAQIRQVTDDGWIENSIDWNNQPAYGSVLSNIILLDNDSWAGSHPIDNWYENDVTSFVQNEFDNGDTTISLMIRCMQENYDNLYYRGSYFHSREAALDNRPTLVVTYEPPLEHGVFINIVPNSQSGANGATLTYNVTVTNTENSSDNFNLTVSDNVIPSWSPTVFPTSLLDVSPGENRSASLMVTLPSNAVGGTIDNIMVTADGIVGSGSASCTATVSVARSLNVLISPSSQSGDNGATLDYTVTISNTGNVSDNYILTDNDNAGWSLNLSKTSVGVASFSSDNTTTLSVSIPGHAIGGAGDNITVTVTGTGINGSASCTAQLLIIRSCSVSISPSSQIGENGATVTYAVTITNTGNISDNYSLYAGDNASPSWSPSVDNTVLTGIAPGANGNTTLRVTFPSSAVAGLIDNINVTATSQADNTINDNSTCIARTVAAEINLVAGWNLVCFTALSPTDTPNKIFAPLVYNTDYLMYYWTAPFGPYSGVFPTQPLKDNLGYWVYMITTSKIVATTGNRPVTENIHLVMGWNLVEFPVVDGTTTPNKIFAPLVYNTDYLMYYWTAPFGPYSGVFPTQPLKDNLGYWVYMKTSNKTVTVP
jgi:uncharacterized membrane protein